MQHICNKNGCDNYPSKIGLCENHLTERCVSVEYTIWLNIKSRCFNKNDKGYKNYGGRGITLWDGWINDSVAFVEYIGKKPTLKHSLDRTNNDGNYEPGNVRWATRVQQANNRRNSPKYTKSICITDAALKAGIF